MRERFAEVRSMIVSAWTSAEEVDVLKVRAIVVALDKEASDLRKMFDDTFDKKDMFGSDSFPNVTRIRAKSELVGRPKKIKEVDTTLDF